MIRFGNLNDLDYVLNLVYNVKIDLKNNDINIWDDDYPNKEIILNDLINNQSIVYIKDNIIVGYIAFSNEKDLFEESFTSSDDFIFLTRVMVHSDYRKLGIAKEMFNFLFDLNYSYYRITVSKLNPKAYNLYLKLGFKYIDTKIYPWGELQLLERGR